MMGYWGNDTATLKSSRNLWFHTGDHGHRDEDDFYFFRPGDRLDPPARGERVGLGGRSACWRCHPDLLESAVYGVASPIGGQEVMAADRPQARRERRRPKRCSTSARTGWRTSPSRATCGSWTSLPKSHAQRILKQELKAEGIEVEGVWDRESVGYKVHR